MGCFATHENDSSQNIKSNRLTHFLKEFNLGTTLNRSRIRKTKGHSTVMLRALFLSFEQRRQEDPRTLESLFRACCQEMQDLSFLDSMQRILRLAVDRLRQYGEFSERVFQRLISAVYGTAIDFLGLDQKLYQRCQRVKL